MNKNLVIIVGPTAVGKTKMSVEIALELNCPVISCDSRQFYQELNVGTAKPTLDERKGVQHYFLDFLSIEKEYTAGIFENEVLTLLQELFQQHDHVVMVGGSTLYVDAITKGFDDLPKNPDLREELIQYTEKYGVEELLKELQDKDPEYFKVIDQNNTVRIQRAIEVIRTSGKKYSELRQGKEKKRNFNMIKIGLDDDRELLYDRINKRVDEMMENGLEEEARGLFHKKGLTALKTVGYQEFFSFFDGEITRDKAIELIKRNSRRYAKRQLTWFRRDSEVSWYGPHDLDQVITFIKSQI